MRGNVHVRFGGRGRENLPAKADQASRPRPNIWPCHPRTPLTSSKSSPAAT